MLPQLLDWQGGVGNTQFIRPKDSTCEGPASGSVGLGAVPLLGPCSGNTRPRARNLVQLPSSAAFSFSIHHPKLPGLLVREGCPEGNVPLGLQKVCVHMSHCAGVLVTFLRVLRLNILLLSFLMSLCIERFVSTRYHWQLQPGQIGWSLKEASFSVGMA